MIKLATYTDNGERLPVLAEFGRRLRPTLPPNVREIEFAFGDWPCRISGGRLVVDGEQRALMFGDELSIALRDVVAHVAEQVCPCCKSLLFADVWRVLEIIDGSSKVIGCRECDSGKGIILDEFGNAWLWDDRDRGHMWHPDHASSHDAWVRRQRARERRAA